MRWCCKMIVKLKRLSLCVFLLSSFAIGLAQEKGGIVGKIVDAKTGEALPGVNVIVKGTYYGAASGLEGDYRIQNVNPGNYTMEVLMIGYKQIQQTGVRVVSGEATVLNFDLEETVLTLGEEVVIIGEKPLFDIEQTASRRSINSAEIQAEVVETVQDIVANQVGVVKSDDEIHIRGGRSYENAYLIDGLSVQDPMAGTGFGLQVSTDAIEEVEVITGGFNAEYGQAMSGIINVKIKDGADKYSGTFTYKRDHFGSYDPGTFLLGTFSTQNEHSFNTDVLEASLSGPEPLTQKILPAIGLNLPGKITFFSSLFMQINDTYLGETIERSTGLPCIDGVNIDRALFPDAANIPDCEDPAFVRRTAPQLNSSIFHDSTFALRQHNSWSGLVKLTWKITPLHKLTLSGNQSVSINQNTRSLQTNLEFVEPGPGFPFAFQRNLDNFNTFTHINKQLSLNWTHTLNTKSFYEIKLARFFTHLRSDVNGKDFTEYEEPQDIVTFPLQYLFNRDSSIVNAVPGDGFWDFGDGFTWHDHYVEEFTSKVDYTRHFGNNAHKVKAGFESTFAEMQMIDIFKPWFGDLGLNNDIYKVNPAYGNFYIQDQLKFKGLVANVGLRLDYWFPGKLVENAVRDTSRFSVTDETRRQFENDTSSLFGRRYKSRLSPRIGISHPISDNQMLFFSYGHFSKRPKPQFIYAKLGENSAKSTFQVFGNPNLGYETTVAYEFGLRHKFTENDVLTLTGYYRDIFDYVTTVNFGGTGRLIGRRFTTYLNLDYARSRGIEFEYRKRAGVLSGSLSGSYQIATGKSSTPDDALLVAQGTLNEKPITEDFLIWDRPWQLGGVVNLNVERGKGRLFGVKIPDNWNLNLRFFAQAGRRYTSQFLLLDRNGNPQTSGTDNRPVYDDDLDQNGEADDPLGSVGATWFWVNVNFKKYFAVFGLKYTFLVEVVNLLDRNNAQIINPVTGKAYEFGDPTPLGFNDPLYPDTQAPVSPFPFNPARFLTRRNVRVGLSVRF